MSDQQIKIKPETKKMLQELMENDESFDAAMRRALDMNLRLKKVGIKL